MAGSGDQGYGGKTHSDQREKHFRARMDRIFQLAGFESVHNGLRHSCISYDRAYSQMVVVSRGSSMEWQSEGACRKHYLQGLDK